MALGEFVKARQTRYGAYLAIYLIVILAVLGAANYLASLEQLAEMLPALH